MRIRDLTGTRHEYVTHVDTVAVPQHQFPNDSLMERVDGRARGHVRQRHMRDVVADACAVLVVCLECVAYPALPVELVEQVRATLSVTFGMYSSYAGLVEGYAFAYRLYGPNLSYLSRVYPHDSHFSLHHLWSIYNGRVNTAGVSWTKNHCALANSKDGIGNRNSRHYKRARCLIQYDRWTTTPHHRLKSMNQTSSRLTPDEQTREDMRRARKGASVDVAAVRDYLYDGRQQWTEHTRVVEVMAKDPAFDKTRRPFMNRTEIYERSLAMTRRVYELEEQLQWSRAERQRAIGLIDDGSPLNLHDAAFEPLLDSQASPELLAQYGALIAHRGIIGCYMQTELAHGSNVAALETTATYLPDSQEFEIHSPTLTSAKWWNGALAKTATHGVVQAKLILGGKDLGPHLFFVQLRSLEDHTILPGIVIGDIGPKAMGAWGATDHGYARFDHYRIPRGNMLSKFAQVTQDGRYIRPPHAKISYGGMLYIRSTMVTSAGWVLAKAATASMRYATVRRQGGINTGGLENQIISYPSVQYRLLPILARAYVFIQLGRVLTRTFAFTSARLAAGDTSTLAETHATASGLKVFASTATARDLETARRSMGGHGFSAFAGLGALYAQYLPAAT
ncbi:hypothetical protein EVG20_g2167 [Dentipellis fragilis]|uniref:Uncharacterized protein n=1 Tax=Dentipellis fragilis TaxID=205917 RepID=A0A4Y9Z7T2_9AGAM|nr:hypothetical protein EVG20_g2167 [Dentipellis fragilis]